MPSRQVHIGKARSFIRAIDLLLKADRPHTLIDPIATLAYYAAMHSFGACFSEGVGVPRRRDFTSHDQRVSAVLRGKTTFTSKVANGFKSLYDFSKIARYAQDKAGVSATRSTPPGSEPHLGQDQGTLNNAMKRLKNCIEKVRELLVVPEQDLPKLNWPAVSP